MRKAIIYFLMGFVKLKISLIVKIFNPKFNLWFIDYLKRWWYHYIKKQASNTNSS